MLTAVKASSDDDDSNLENLVLKFTTVFENFCE